MDEIDIPTIRKKSIHGVLALISRTFILNVISFIASLLVFTFLSPREVGVYVAVIAVQRVISFFTDFGLGAALIQKKEAIEDEDIATTFTIQSGVTLFIFLLLFLFQNQVGYYFDLNSSGIQLLLALVFCIFLSSFKIIPSILLERKIDFKKLIIPQIVESAVFNGILIVLLIQDFGISSFTWAFLVSSSIGIPAYYLISPWKIKIGVYRKSFKALKFGVQFQLKNILATLKDDLLIVLLSRILPYSQLGYIGFGQRNAFFSFRYIVDSVTKVTFSTYSRLQDDKHLLKIAVEKSLFFVSTAMFPMMVGLILTAPYFISYIPKWQDKWEPAIISLIFFSLNAMVSSLSNVLITVLDASGKVGVTLRLMVLWTILTWILTFVAVQMIGYNGVAIASFLVTLTLGITVYLVKQVVTFHFMKSIYKPIIGTFIMAGVVFIGLQIFTTNLPTLISVIIIGAISYGTSMYFLAGKELVQEIKKLREDL